MAGVAQQIKMQSDQLLVQVETVVEAQICDLRKEVVSKNEEQDTKFDVPNKRMETMDSKSEDFLAT
eukprot:10577471-Karenia_brevis.AAC.1